MMVLKCDKERKSFKQYKIELKEQRRKVKKASGIPVDLAAEGDKSVLTESLEVGPLSPYNV